MTLQDEAFLINMTCLVLNVNALHQGFLIHVTHLVNLLHMYNATQLFIHSYSLVFLSEACF